MSICHFLLSFLVTTIGQTTSTEKHVLDIVGDYPMVLVVVDSDAPSVEKCYYHANGQTLMQKAGASRYLYLHDRLGSTRQVINASASVVNSYTYDPWGNAFASETSETVANHYQFANYHWDSTVGMYYLNARWYDPVILRFTGRDPVKGDFSEPLSLHAYLYCINNPVNATDPTGELLGLLGGSGWGQKMRASSMAMGSRAMAFAGRVYTAAFYRAAMMQLFIYNLMYEGKISTSFFRGPEWGKWGPNQSLQGWHFHLPWGPGMGKHHLPQEFSDWWKNFINVFFK